MRMSIGTAQLFFLVLLHFSSVVIFRDLNSNMNRKNYLLFILLEKEQSLIFINQTLFLVNYARIAPFFYFFHTHHTVNCHRESTLKFQHKVILIEQTKSKFILGNMQE